MGGDSAPGCTVAGAVRGAQKVLRTSRSFSSAIRRASNRSFARRLKRGRWICVSRFYTPRRSSTWATSATDAVRKKKDSSISRAIELLAKGGAEALVSAGHTGALVAAAIDSTEDAARRCNGPGSLPMMPADGSHHFLVLDAGRQRRLRPGAFAPLRHHGLGLLEAKC